MHYAFHFINYVSLDHNLETKNKKILALSLSILVLITNLILLKTDEYKNLVTDYNKRLESVINLIDKDVEKISHRWISHI